jgi:hypothetical protein
MFAGMVGVLSNFHFSHLAHYLSCVQVHMSTSELWPGPLWLASL